MEEINELSLILLETLTNKSKDEAFEEIKNHIILIDNKENNAAINFPGGLKWFGVSEALKREHLNGKIVILDFFTYCCMNCIHILPHLKALEHRFYDNPVVQVIGVHSPKFPNEKDVKNLRNAIAKLDITHPVVNDPETILWNELDIVCWPTLLILGPSGKPLLTIVGEGHHGALNLFVDCAVEFYEEMALLNSRPVPLSRTSLPVTGSLLSYPGAVTAAPDGTLALADTGHHRVLILSPAGAVQEVIGGPTPGLQDGEFASARFRDPQGLAFYFNNRTGGMCLFVADTGNHVVRRCDLMNRRVLTDVGIAQQGADLQGGGMGRYQAISSPWGLCIIPAPSSSSAAASQNMPELSRCSPVPPPGMSHISNVPLPPMMPQTSNMPPVPPPLTPQTPNVVPPPPPMMPQGVGSGPPPPPAPKVPSAGNLSSATVTDRPPVLLIAMSGSHQIWAYFLRDTVWWKDKHHSEGTCCAIVGSGVEENRNNRYPHKAGLAQPSGICYSPAEAAIFVADSESSTVRRICVNSGAVSAVVGGQTAPDNLFSYGDKDGIRNDAKLQHPLDVSWHQNETASTLFLVDTYNHKLKSVDLQSGSCKTIRLTIDTPLCEPGGVCAVGEHLYIADTNNHRLIKVSQRDWSAHEVEIKMSSQYMKSKIRRVWETSIPVHSSGSDITLSVELGSQYSGRWRVAADNSTNILMTRQVGDVENGQMNIEFRAKSNDEATVDIDLAECSGDACHMRYYRLLAKTVVAVDAPKVKSVSFSPDILCAR